MASDEEHQTIKTHEELWQAIEEHRVELREWRTELSDRLDNIEAFHANLPKAMAKIAADAAERGEWLEHSFPVDGFDTFGDWIHQQVDDHRKYDTYGPMLHAIVDMLQGPEQHDLEGRIIGRVHDRGVVAQIAKLNEKMENGGVPAKLSVGQQVALWVAAIGGASTVLAALVQVLG